MLQLLHAGVIAICRQFVAVFAIALILLSTELSGGGVNLSSAKVSLFCLELCFGRRGSGTNDQPIDPSNSNCDAPSLSLQTTCSVQASSNDGRSPIWSCRYSIVDIGDTASTAPDCGDCRNVRGRLVRLTRMACPDEPWRSWIWCNRLRWCEGN